jgi:DNA-binding response OmpR family regulator
MKAAPKQVLLLEDDANLGLILQEHLKLNGFAVDLLTDGQAGTAAAKKTPYDLCLVDVMMPRKDGFSFVRDLRKDGNAVPVIFLTAKAMREDRIEGFRAGADDYVTKPFSMEELLLRIEAVLRRTRQEGSDDPTPGPLAIGKYMFDSSTRELAIGGKKRRLTQREADLLELLCRKKNRVADRSDVLTEIWGEDSYFNSRSMDVFLTRLRKYFKGDPSVQIMTVHGRGVKLVVTQR